MYSRVLRFAPSSNGYLHLGHAYSALLNSDMARELGGRLWLRIEDIDTERCRPEYEQAIYEDLRWLGMHWQEPVRRQSEHFSDYEMAIGRLEARRPALSEFREPTRTRRAHGGARSARRLAARSRRRADLSGTRAQIVGWRNAGAAATRRAVRAAARHGQGGGARRRADLDRDRIGPQGQTGVITAAPQMWGDVSWRARSRRRAIILPPSSTMRCKA